MPLSTLVPTVEFEPCDWAAPGYESLIGSPQWEAFWDASLAPWRVRPIVPGAWHIPVSAIVSDEALTKLIRIALKDVLGPHDEPTHVDADEEQVGALSGGYALIGSDALYPSCCCDLGDLTAWVEVTKLEPGESMLLAIGHGVWSARREDEHVIVTEGSESVAIEPLTARVSVASLRAATESAAQARDAFRLRLRPLLHRLVQDEARAERLSRLLVGLAAT